MYIDSLLNMLLCSISILLRMFSLMFIRDTGLSVVFLSCSDFVWFWYWGVLTSQNELGSVPLTNIFIMVLVMIGFVFKCKSVLWVVVMWYGERNLMWNVIHIGQFKKRDKIDWFCGDNIEPKWNETLWNNIIVHLVSRQVTWIY